ncbi:AFR187Cp [Eremothecium gossypii ATCC 10895]|uniref:Increased recombination centers protein 19 n=1 Tax=Eremothecium gossypii (strain ATCC 10895 / CBS 109.51 / FGSC 9923 / NRRL Y-1056) TaxID=284811 RepID=IRC19_EREGS|nr:AFR187Cp [Eremothecium gossypii ATCC 10895]Q753Y5.1 RecName: Full=Increased recombination centers protein 19 [Eremothecium gossypii ATCC 10895]AAS53558.1 AFR187Cp [Eremothecium gossypii ATCC 10895]AEY97871.1 FAFR187Cp [Eremothecium gossypii FDAG1]
MLPLAIPPNNIVRAMSSPNATGPLMRTSKAIITSNYTLLTDKTPYLLPVCFNESCRAEQVRMLYRRFFRLRPLVAQRAMIKESYTNYIRVKFSEDYALKRRQALPQNTCPVLDAIEAGRRSLTFILKAVSEIEDADSNPELAYDNYICRKILKNVLTLEYQRERLEFKNPKRKQILRQNYEYLDAKYHDPKYTSLRNADVSIIHFNETLGTRL